MRPAALALASVLALALTTATAHHEWCGYVDRSDATARTPDGTYYVVVDGDPREGATLWIYEESNGEAGLQRGDTTIGDEGHFCRLDTIVF